MRCSSNISLMPLWSEHWSIGSCYQKRKCSRWFTRFRTVFLWSLFRDKGIWKLAPRNTQVALKRRVQKTTVQYLIIEMVFWEYLRCLTNNILSIWLGWASRSKTGESHKA
jgi:hypothetical protein